jgi:hypothetical protein
MAKTTAKKFSPKKQAIVDELENLKRKTALMQSCHGQQAEKLSRLENRSTLVVVVLSGLTLVATTAEARTIFTFLTEDDLKKVTAVFSLVVFLLTIVKNQVGWGTKAGIHSTSLNAFTRFLRHIDFILKAVDDKSDDEIEITALDLAKEYSDICAASPDIPSKEFLKFKQNHLQIIAVSRALDKDPFAPLRSLYRRFKNPNKKP